MFQVSFANIPKETVRFHWGAYNAVGQCQSADTEYKTSQYFVLCKYQCTNELFCGFRVLTPDWCLIPLDVPGTCTLRIGLLCGALRKHGTRKETRVAANKKAPNGFGVQEFESVFLPNSKRKHAGLGRQCSASGAAAASNLQAALAQQQSVGPRGDTGDQRRDASRSGDEEEPQNAAGPSWMAIGAGNDSGILYARCAEATHFLGIGAGKDKRTDSGIVYASARGEEATHFLTYA